MAVQLTRRRFSVKEYYQMAEAGILTEDDRVELIDGEILEMSPIGSPHAACVMRLNRLLTQTAGRQALVGVQSPVRLSEYTEPLPDLALLRPRPDFYASGHPTPEDVFLVIEVADTSVDYDRRVKAPLYARSGIPEFWLVNLVRETITVYREPAPTGYRVTRTAQRGETLAPLAFLDFDIALADILGEG